MDMIDIIAKVVYKDKEPQIVGSTKLKKTTCYIADETANSKLILRENNIDDVDVGEVYSAIVELITCAILVFFFLSLLLFF